MLFAFIGALILSVHGLTDFEHDVRAFTFIYHDNQRVLLIIHNTNCYFFDVDTALRGQLNSPGTRDALEDQVKQAILRQDSGIRAASLTAVRDRFEDRLADFHCLDKDIFTIELTAPMTSTARACEDTLKAPTTCAQLDSLLGGTVCRDPGTRAACPVYCGHCDVTTAPTTVPTTTRTPATPPPRPGSRCVKCGDTARQTPCDEVDLILGSTERCPDTAPYCMNDIYQNRDVVKQYRRCVDETECDKLWYQGTSDKVLCTNFDPNVPSRDLVCHLCCYGDGCNLDNVPNVSTRYRP